ncbi:zinc finger protein 36 family 3 protein [Cryptosporidium felis]|nr:zinc finger protein 36 family 3 protein [Cryptosporidium felis]
MEARLNNDDTNGYCEEEIDLSAGDDLKFFRKMEVEEDLACSSSTGFSSCDGSSKSSRNFSSIDNLRMLMTGGTNGSISAAAGGLGEGDCQEVGCSEGGVFREAGEKKRSVSMLDWGFERLLDISMVRKLLPSMSKEEYKKFILAYTSYLVLYSTRKPFSVVKLQIQEDLSLSTSVLGWIDTTFLGSYAFGQLVIPTLFESVKINEYICLSFICSAVASLAFGLSGGPASLLLIWLFNGLFHAGVYPMLVKYLIICFGASERGRILGVWTTSQQLGAMVSTAFSASICLRLGWRSVFYIPSVFVFVFGIIVYKHLNKPRSLYVYGNLPYGDQNGDENCSSMVLVAIGENNIGIGTVRGGGWEEKEQLNAEGSTLVFRHGSEAIGPGGLGGDRYSEMRRDSPTSPSSPPPQGACRQISAALSGEGFSGTEGGAEEAVFEGGTGNDREVVGDAASQRPDKENGSFAGGKMETSRDCVSASLSAERTRFSGLTSFTTGLSPTKKKRPQSNRWDYTGESVEVKLNVGSYLGEDAGRKEQSKKGSDGEVNADYAKGGDSEGGGEADCEGGGLSSFCIQNVESSSMGEKLVILFKIPHIMNIAISYFFVKLIRYSMLFWLPYYLIRELSYGPSIAGYSSMLFDIGGIVGAISAGAIADTFFGGKRILVACYMTVLVSLSILFFILITKTSFNALILFGITLMGFCVSGPDSILGSTAAQDVFEKSGITIKSVDSMATGVVNGLGALGAVAQGTLTAYISELYGWNSLFFCLLGFSALSFLILMPASKSKVHTKH